MSNDGKNCKSKGCKESATTSGFCRLHYLMNWKSLQAKVPKDQVPIEDMARELLEQYPDDYIRKAHEAGHDYTELDGASFNDELESIYDRFGGDDIEIIKREIYRRDS